MAEVDQVVLAEACASLGVDVADVIAWRAYDAGVVVVLRDGRKLRSWEAAEQEVPVVTGPAAAPAEPVTSGPAGRPAKRDKK